MSARWAAGRGPGWALAAAAGLLLAERGWTVARWPALLDGDEAVIGLMARHILEGARPVYYYGQQYLGAFDAYLAAGAFAALGATPLALRLPQLLLFGLFVLVHAALVGRLHGRGTAALSCLLLAAPHPLLLELTIGPDLTFGAQAVPGTLALLLVAKEPRRGWLVAATLFGLVGGFLLWVKATGLPYVAVAAVVWLLLTPEWRALRWRVPARAAAVGAPIALAGLAGAAVLAVFASGCAPGVLPPGAPRAGAVVLAAAGGLVAAGVLAVSRRRTRLLIGVAAVAVGAGVGSAPAWLAGGGAPRLGGVVPSCPLDAGERAGLVGREIVPVLFGIPTAAGSGVERLGLLVGTMAVAVLVVAYLARMLPTWRRLVGLRLEESDRPGLVVGLLLAATVAAAVLSGNVIDAAAARYLTPAWQAGSVVAAVGLLALPVGALARAAVLVAWLAPSWTLDAREVRRQWADVWSLETTAAIETYLAGHGARTAYAEYWTAYPLTFLAGERLVVAPLSRTDRYPPYRERAAAAETYGLIVERGGPPVGSLAEAVRALCVGALPSAPVDEATLARLAHSEVAARTSIGRWDVLALRRAAAATGPTTCAGQELTLRSVRVPAGPVAPGEALPVTLDVAVEGRLSHRYVASARLKDAGGQVVAAVDEPLVPLDPRARAAAAGELRPTLRLPIGSAVQAGVYALDLVLFDHDWRTVRPWRDEARAGGSDTVRQLIVGTPPGLLPADAAVPRRLDARLGHEIALVGVGGPEVRDGRVAVDLYWRALGAIGRDYTIFVQLLDGEGRLVGQRDGYAWEGALPTSAWPAGWAIKDTVAIEPPAGARPGTHRLIAGMYLLATMERLPTADAAGRAARDYVELGTVVLP